MMGRSAIARPLGALRCLTAASLMPVASAFILSRPLFTSSRAPFASPAVAAFSPSSAGRLRLRATMSTAEGDSVVAGMEKKIKDALNPTKLEVIPAYGDPNGSHVTISVVSEAFEGKRSVQRQQMVYKIIWEEMQGAIHAVDQMVCQTPKENGA
eukprot:CAMPEP_0173439378 /NCGR_PEP_ID=MMETSP1357-20121228/20919_1 /TAXON_ID=77926 /ORGANISM="Hemiselmis rufescens, Strain PCC563" /LENGTH=153 /DNA_ID=CAMNT_0014404739 /DNA_START=10 /DNA_END=471 /DNA_ORIENTATION=-